MFMGLETEINNRLRLENKGAFADGLPIDAFPQKVQEIIFDLEHYENFKIEYVMAALISATACAIGNTFNIHVKGSWCAPAMLYLILVGRPGLGKTHPVSFAYSPIRERDAMNLERFNSEYRSWSAQNAGLKPAEIEMLETRPKLVKTLLNDFTPEALISIHRDNPRGIAIYVDEILGFFKTTNRYNNSNLTEMLLSIYSGQPIDYTRKSEKVPTYIKRPFLNIIGTVQTKVLPEICSRQFMDNGLIDRFLFAYPADCSVSVWKDMEYDCPNNTEAVWRGILGRILDLNCLMDQSGTAALPITLEMERTAKSRFYEWNNGILADINSITDDSLVDSRQMKLSNNGARLALAFQILRWACGESHKEFVDADSVESAIRMIRFFEGCFQRALDACPDSCPTDRKQVILDSLPHSFSTSEAIEAAVREGYSQRTANDLLREWCSRRPFALRKVRHGVYEKTQEK